MDLPEPRRGHFRLRRGRRTDPHPLRRRLGGSVAVALEAVGAQGVGDADHATISEDDLSEESRRALEALGYIDAE